MLLGTVSCDSQKRSSPSHGKCGLASSRPLKPVWIGASRLGWPRDRTLWVGMGSFLALMTLARPWWFWENYRARSLRGLIGDEPTAGLYLVIAAAMIWVGLFTEWTFGPQ